MIQLELSAGPVEKPPKIYVVSSCDQRSLHHMKVKVMLRAVDNQRGAAQELGQIVRLSGISKSGFHAPAAERSGVRLRLLFVEVCNEDVIALVGFKKIANRHTPNGAYAPEDDKAMPLLSRIHSMSPCPPRAGERVSRRV